MLLMGCAFSALWLLALPWVGSLWVWVLDVVRSPLGLAENTTALHFQFGGRLALVLPKLAVAAIAPTFSHLMVSGAVCILLAIVSFLLPETQAPTSYFLRAVALIHGSAVAFFLFQPWPYPYTAGDYLTGLTGAGMGLIALVPPILAATHWLLDYSMTKKLGLLVLIMGYLFLMIPVKYAVHAVVLSLGGLLYMPVLFILFGLPVEVFAFIALFSWGLSWKARKRRPDAPLSVGPTPFVASIGRAAVLLVGLLAAGSTTAQAQVTFRDDFDSATFSGTNGTAAWSGNWVEGGESDGPTAGTLRITTDTAPYALMIGESGRSLYREADLSAYAGAALTFRYRRQGIEQAMEYVAIEASTGGGWTEIGRVTGDDDIIPLADADYLQAAFDLSGFISATTRIRFRGQALDAGGDWIYIDDVEITASTATADLSLALSTSTLTPPAGSSITATFTLSNDGPGSSAATNVAIAIPSSLLITGSSVSQGTWDEASSLWQLGTVTSGSAPTLQLTMTVGGFDPMTLSGEVQSSAASDPDSTPGNGSTTEDDDASDLITPTEIGGQICYLVADSGDNLTKILRSGLAETLVGATGTTTMEATVYWPGTDMLYGADANTFGILDPATGLFSPKPTSFGTADGALGSLALTDVDGMAFHPHTGELWATNRREAAASDEDLLFKVDLATGTFIADAFGAGVDYLVVGSIAATGFGDIDDLAIDATDGTFYAIANNGGFGDMLVTIDPTDGSVTAIGALGVDDMEGFSFDGYGVLYGTQGNPSALYTINKSTGVATKIVDLSAGGNDYESVSCLTDGVNDITGNVFQDVDGDGIYDVGQDLAAAGITVQLYRDANNNGIVDGADTLLATDDSDASGNWSFTVAAEGNFVMQIDTGDLPADGTLTTDNVEVANFTDFGNTDTPNRFGFKRPGDLSVTVVVDDPTPTVGETVVLTITLTNDGPSDASGVTLSDVFPVGLTYVSDVPAQGSYDDATNTWTVGAIPAGGSLTLEITATAASGGVHVYSSQVATSETDDIDSTPGNDVPSEDDQDSTSLTINSHPVAVDDADETKVNQGISITVLPNDSDPEGDDLEITAFDAATTQGGTAALNDNGTPGDTTDDYFDYVPALDFVGTDTFTYTISDGNGGSDTATVTVVVSPLIDLSVTIVVDDATPTVGDQVTYTITLANAGPSTATGIIVADVLPAGVSWISDVPDQGTYNNALGVWTVGTLAKNGSLDLVITVNVDQDGIIVNTTQVTAATETDVDSTPNNSIPSEDDQDSVSITASPLIDLSLVMAVDDPSPTEGGTVVFTLTLANDGPSDATGVEVTNTLPAGLTFVSATPSQGTFDSGTGVWTVGNVNNGAGGTLDITATVDTPNPVTNSAEVTAANETDVDSTPNNDTPSEDDQDSKTLMVTTLIDLSVSIGVDDATPTVGDQITYTITLANAGPSTATGITVADILPAGVTWVSDVPDQGTYDSGTGVWTVGSLASGGSLNLAITVTVDQDGAIVNMTQVTAANETDVDSTPNNSIPSEDDQDSVSITASPLIDLSLVMGVDDPAPAEGGTVTFTVTLANDGPSDATGVEVTNTLPPGLTFVSSTPSQGTFDSGTGVWTVGGVNNGAGATLDITVTVDTPNPATNSAEVTAATETDVDSTPNNDMPAEDDQDDATVTPTGGTGGGGGGLESNGSLSGKLARVLFARRLASDQASGIGALPRFMYDRPAGKSAATSSEILRSIVPESGPGQSLPFESSPRDLIPVTNAIDVVAADFIRSRDDRRIGAVFATLTPGALYEHTKVVCDRLQGAELVSVRRIEAAGHPFLISRLIHESGAIDHAVNYVAYRSGGGFVVDSRFRLDEYLPAGAADEVINVQIWSVSREYTIEMLEASLQRLAQEGPITFLNDGANPPRLPGLFVRTGHYAEGKLHLTLQNPGGATRIAITGGTMQRTELGDRTTFETSVNVPAPDENGTSRVSIPVGPVFDASFFVETDSGDKDVVYLADGAWSYTYDGDGADVQDFDVQADVTAAKSGTHLVERSVSMTGQVKTWAVLFRYLRANGRPLDLSAYNYVEFTASGQGQLRVLFEKESVRTSDHFGTVIKLSDEPTTHRIWFDDLRRPDGTGKLDASDLLLISFYMIGEQGRTTPFSLQVGELRFGGAEGDPLAVTPEAYELKQNFPNPFNPSTRLTFGIPTDQKVRLEVFDMLGRSVGRLVDGFVTAGRHDVLFDASGLSSGVYLYRLDVGGQILVRRMTLLR